MSGNSSLLKETVKDLSDHGKNTNDVLWVGSRDGAFAMGWYRFEKIANFDYDSGFGSPKIATDLVVVGSDWWLERHEHDGSEWWEFKSAPQKQTDAKSFSIVGGAEYMWDNLAEMNHGGDTDEVTE